MTPQALRRVLRADDLWCRFQALSLQVNERNDLPRLRKELMTSHATRPSRALSNKKGIRVDDVMTASLDDMAKRSRAVEIIVNTNKDARLLRSAMEAVMGHILSEYADSLRTVRSKADRELVVAALMVNENKVLHGIEQLIESAEYLVEDIDKTGWGMRNIVQLLALSMQRENIVTSASV